MDVVQRLAIVVIAVAAATVVAGCGSPSEHYRLSRTRSCLAKRGFATDVENNWLFKPSEGSLLVKFGIQAVGLEFGHDVREADRLRE